MIAEGDDNIPTDHNEGNHIEDHSGVAPTFRIDNDDDLEEQRLTPIISDTPSTTSSTTTSLSTSSTPTVPSNYICPLTLHVMQEPVNDGCGHCFERHAIVEWLADHEMCPISRKPLKRSHLYPADALQSRIRRWRESRSSSTDNTHFNINSDEGAAGIMLESSSSSSDHSEVMGSLLLPQELQVLQIIKVRARNRQSKRDFHNCLWTVAATVAIFLCLASILAIKYWEIELQGPI
jgi:hypothetical protein